MFSRTTWPWKCILCHFCNLSYRYNWLYFKEPVKYLLAFKVIHVTKRIKITVTLNLPVWSHEEEKKNSFPKRKADKIVINSKYCKILLYSPKIKNQWRRFLDNGFTESENFYPFKKVFPSKHLFLTVFSPVILSIEQI